jgi:hypothetical protein
MKGKAAWVGLEVCTAVTIVLVCIVLSGRRFGNGHFTGRGLGFSVVCIAVVCFEIFKQTRWPRYVNLREPASSLSGDLNKTAPEKAGPMFWWMGIALLYGAVAEMTYRVIAIPNHIGIITFAEVYVADLCFAIARRNPSFEELQRR